jgi:type VI secretion system secreted protein Hcp
MAVNAYIKFEGIDGPSTSKKGHVDILSFSFGASNTATYGTGASGKESTAGVTQIGDVTFMKVTDKTTPTLFGHCTTGFHIPKATLLYDKPVGGAQEDYFKVEMDDVIITSYQVSGSAENPVESLSLAFEKVKVYYNPQDDEGKLTGWVDKGWDISLGKKF